MCLNLDAIYYLISPLKLIILRARLFELLSTLFILFFWEDWWKEFEVATVEFLVDEFVDELADCFSVAHD